MFDRELWSAVGVLALVCLAVRLLGIVLATVGMWLAIIVSNIIVNMPRYIARLLNFIVDNVRYWRTVLEMTRPFSRARQRAQARAEQIFARLNKMNTEETLEEV